MSTTSKNYRPWLANEDDKLVEALMNMVNTGSYRADNGFKSGYLQHLESMLKESLPGAGILAKPHIESRMRTLKKDFAVIFDMLNSSGFGYDKELKTVTVTSPGVWDDYIASRPKADKWKNKRLPHYEELCVIFGKDRAQENRAKVPSQMEDDVNMDEQDQQIDDGFDEELEGSHSATRHSNTNLEDTSSSRSKKRKASSQLINLVESLTDAVASFGDSLKESSTQLSEGIKHEIDLEKKSSMITYELSKMTSLTQLERFRAIKKIKSDPQNVMTFWDLEEHERVDWVKFMMSE